MPTVEFEYVAVVPLQCGLPDGSVHTYQPGEYVPAEVLGRSIGHLVMADKLARIARNVDDPEISVAQVSAVLESEPAAAEVLPDSPSTPGPEDEEPDLERAALAAATSSEWPASIGGGLYQLSDGTHVKGKKAAEIAQAALTG